MLRSAKHLFGYDIQARDGEIGECRDFLFDDTNWVIRYMVVAIGSWLARKSVLIPPRELMSPNWEAKKFPVSLTKEQVENSPLIDLQKPVSRQKEIELHEYFGWQPYWHFTAPIPTAVPVPAPKEEPEIKDPHLRSSREVKGYHLQATDGEIGHVDDFILEDEIWMYRYVVVDTRNWLPGRHVIVPPDWFQNVSWEERKVFADVDKELVKNSPVYDPSSPVNRSYEVRLYNYYGRPKYWV